MKFPLKFILVVGTIVLVLNVVMKINRSSMLFYPLYPGVLAHFFIEGAHGKSPHPVLGYAVEVATNVLAYSLICLAAKSIFYSN